MEICLSPAEFFAALTIAGVVLIVLVFVPVQIAAKCRRMRKQYRRLTCRICGYRFLRRDDACTCPVCAARNR